MAAPTGIVRTGGTGDGDKTMTMTYEDQLAIGGNLNAAIQMALSEYDLDQRPELVSAIAQAVLVQLDRAGYQITRK